MFDLSFAELLVIAVVALVVLGPERLPRAARFTGLWVRRARAQWQSVRSEFERELADEELKRNIDQARSAMREADRDVRGAEAAVRRETQQLRDGVTVTTTVPRETTETSAGTSAVPVALATTPMTDSAAVVEVPSSAPGNEPDGPDGERR